MWWVQHEDFFFWLNGDEKIFHLGEKKEKLLVALVVGLLNFWHRLNLVELFCCCWMWCHSYLFMIFNKQFYYSFDDIMHSSHKHLTEYFPYLFPLHRLFSAICDVIVLAIMPAFVFVNHSSWRWWCWILIFRIWQIFKSIIMIVLICNNKRLNKRTVWL